MKLLKLRMKTYFVIGNNFFINNERLVIVNASHRIVTMYPKVRKNIN